MSKARFTLLGLLCLGSLMFPADAREVSGKVMAVFHEPVSINNRVHDKISVTISNCNPAGQLETFSYSAGTLSTENALGYLYGQLVGSAHAMVMKTPYMNTVSGHVTLAVNENNIIQKTTFWGYNWECGRNLDAMPPQQGNPANPQQSGNMMPPQQGGYPQPNPAYGYPQQAPPPTQNTTPSVPGVNPVDIMRRFGF